jgi:transposase
VAEKRDSQFARSTTSGAPSKLNDAHRSQLKAWIDDEPPNCLAWTKRGKVHGITAKRAQLITAKLWQSVYGSLVF